jgi:hypothetical protein
MFLFLLLSVDVCLTGAVRSVWANPNVSCTSVVPTVSAANGIFYCLGKRPAADANPPHSVSGATSATATAATSAATAAATAADAGAGASTGANFIGGSSDVDRLRDQYTIEAVSWETGASLFHVPIGSTLLSNGLYAGTIVGSKVTIIFLSI